MSCTNCYNGCTEIVSDKCVKYTGIDIPALGITNGDTLLTVENAITSFLTSVLTGQGVKPTIDPLIICQAVQQHLPVCTVCDGFTLNEILTAIIKAVCDIQVQINAINTTLNILNADYTIGCLTGVTSSTDTHDILQAVINKLCLVDSNLTALSADVLNNYVPVDSSPGYPGINDYIEAYINSTSSSLISNKMIPYAAIPYYGTLSNFDGTGAGIGDWINVYLCNGQNFTPDLRGRTLVGATTGMFGNDLLPTVDPALPNNPSYTLSGIIPPLVPTVSGSNEVPLNVSQIPNHTHTVVVEVTDPGHGHDLKASHESGGSKDNRGFFALDQSNPIVEHPALLGDPSIMELDGSGNGIGSSDTGIAVNVVVNPTGGGEAHTNTQPSVACYFIMYIP